MSLKWEGVMPAVTTKFKDNDELDYENFEKNIKAQVEAGIHGVVLGGTLGEASTLSAAEKDDLVKHTLNIVNGKIPVIINIAEQVTKEAVKVAQRAEELGAQGLMLLPPMRYKATDRETVIYFKDIARSTSLPIMIYNNPVDYKIEVTPDMFEELLKTDTIKAVKESTRVVTNVTNLKNRFGDDLKILTGVDTIAFESLVAGADGWVAGLCDAYPAETVAIYKLVKAGKIKEALAIHRWFMPLLDLDLSPQLVQNIKLAEVATGIGTENVRKPRLPLAGKERERVQDIIDRAMQSRPKLPEYQNLQEV